MSIKLFFLASILAIASAQFLNVTCHQEGTQPATDCNSFVETFCELTTQTRLRGGDNVGRCYNAASTGNRCDFVAFNIKQDQAIRATPSLLNCELALVSTLQGCPTVGGFSLPNGANPNDSFVYSLDRNSPTCTVHVQGGT